MSESVSGVLPTSSLQLLSERWEGIGLPPNLKLLLSWPSEGLEFLDEARGLPGRSRTMSMEGLSRGTLRRRQYSSSSEGIVSCDSPTSSIGKSPTVVERPMLEVEESWVSMGREGTGGISMALSGKLYLKSTLAGVLKAFSSCLTKLCRSEAPDSLSMRISPVKLKDFLVSSSEVTSDSPEVESAWKTWVQKTGTGSVGRVAASVRPGGREASKGEG